MPSLHDLPDILAVVLTGALYIVPPVSLALLAYCIVRKRQIGAWIAGVVAAVSLVPLTIFAIVYYIAASFPEQRQQQLSSLQRQPIPLADRPRSLSVEGELGTAARLISAGFLDEIIQYPDGRSWPKRMRLTRRHDSGCVEENTNPSYFSETSSSAMMARSAYMVCIAQTRLDNPPADEPPIELARDAFAPLAIRNKPGEQDYKFTYRAWQLDWAEPNSGKLIDYAEILYVEKPVYYLTSQFGFFHAGGRQYGERHDWNSYEFVAAALGFDPVKDVPFSAPPDDLTQAMAGLTARMNAGKGGHGDALRLLLGQWGDNPVLRQGLANLDPKQASVFVVDSLRILGLPEFDAKRRELYPKLHEYRDVLMKLCPMLSDSTVCEKMLPEIEKRASEGVYSES